MTDVHSQNLNLHEQEIAQLATPATIERTALVSTAPTAESGSSTTEFWAAQITSTVLAVMAVLNLTGQFHIDDQARAVVTAAILPTLGLVQGLYALSRGLRKAGSQG